MTTGMTLFICHQETLGSHQIKSSTSTINSAACINRSAESGAMASSDPVAIPDERDSADVGGARQIAWVGHLVWYLGGRSTRGGRDGVTSRQHG